MQQAHAEKDAHPPHPAHQESIYRLSSSPPKTFELAEEKQPQSLAVQNEVAEPVPAEQTTPPVQVENLVVVGSFHDLYIFCRNGDNLIVIDQHAAHERLVFERLKNMLSSGGVARQGLLIPEVIELAPEEVEALVQKLDN